MRLTLVVLAAGLGSRYGGLKQLDAIGPSGETMLDYAVSDALAAGFNRVLFVIRRDFADVFREQIGAKYAERAAVDYCFQSLDALPDGFSPPRGRTKPLGTGHAVWCARDSLDGPFAVINADDFYGRDSFVQLAAFFHPQASPRPTRPQFASVGFRLASTLSQNGSVSRGICTVSGDHSLRSVVEHTGIRTEDIGPGRTFSGEEMVSMNCWGFTPALFPKLDRRLRDFLRTQDVNPRAEFYLPVAVSDMIAAEEIEVRVLPTRSVWIGITYREDKQDAMAALAKLAATGG